MTFAGRSIIAVALTGTLLATVVHAQGISIDIPAGTMIEGNNGVVTKVVQCGLDHAFLGYKECSVEIYRNGELQDGGLRRYPADQVLKDLNSAREAKGMRTLTPDQASGRQPWPENAQISASPGPAARTAPFPATQVVRTNPVSGATTAVGGACPRTPYVELPGTSPPTAATFRKVMESGHTFQRSAYLWTGVTFEAFTVGAPVRNKVTMRPGVGPERVTDAAPVDTALYPVRTTYVLCRQYSSGPDRARISTGNYCFVSRTGKWACGTDSRVARFTSTPVN